MINASPTLLSESVFPISDMAFCFKRKHSDQDIETVLLSADENLILKPVLTNSLEI